MIEAEPGDRCPTEEQLETIATDLAVPAEVSRHVSQCQDCQSAVREIRANNAFLSDVGDRLGGRFGPGSSPSVAGEIPGYSIESEISRGGQGVVYKAVQIATRRHVAVKVLAGGVLATSRQRLRFEREIELAASLRHPNIVTVHESGVTGDGLRYVVMEYVTGQPLDRYVAAVRERPGHQKVAVRSEPREILALLAKVCEAVWHAHQHGVIHRDLKPGNILVIQEGHLGPTDLGIAAARPKVLDFGLAKPVVPLVGAAPTLDGEFLGTLAYASPEQARGDPSQVDTRTDVYSLGVILYELLAGRPPHPVSDSIPAMIRHINETQPRKLSGSRPGLDADIETIVLKALEKDKNRRYQSAGDLARDIRHYLKNEPIEARRDSSWYIIRKLVQRKRWHVAVGLVVLALTIGLSAQWSRMRGLASARDEAIVRQPWVGQGDDPGADGLYAGFLKRLQAGQTTPQEQDLFFTNAFGLELNTRKLWSLEQRVAAVIDRRRRIDLREYGYTPLVTIILLLNGERVSPVFCMPWPTAEGSFTAHEDSATPNRDSMTDPELLIAECVICVHRTEDVPADVCNQAKPNSDWAHPNTIWRQVRMLEAPITFLSTLPPGYPAAIVDAETQRRVEQAFQAERILLTASSVNIEYRYGLNMPIAGEVEVLGPDGSELVPPSRLSKFTRTGAVGTREKDYNVHMHTEILNAVAHGEIDSLRLTIKPSFDMALLQPDFEVYYGLPIERDVPVVLAAGDGTHEKP